MAAMGDYRIDDNRSAGLLAAKYAYGGHSDGLDADADADAPHASEGLKADFPDFRSIGSRFERLHPFDLEDLGLPKYQAYLQKFYSVNRNTPASVASTAYQCLEMENRKQHLLEVTGAYFFVKGNNIHRYMLDLVEDTSEPISPFFTDAATCIAKETELMNYWLSKGYRVSEDERKLHQLFRHWALQALLFKGDWCVEISAALVGIRKEVELLLAVKSLGVPNMSMKIQQFALELMRDKFDDLHWGIPKNWDDNSGEMASGEMASETHDDDEMEEEVICGEMASETHDDDEMEEEVIWVDLEKLTQEADPLSSVLKNVDFSRMEVTGPVLIFPKQKNKCVIDKMKELKITKHSVTSKSSSQRKLSGSHSKRISSAVWK